MQMLVNAVADVTAEYLQYELNINGKDLEEYKAFLDSFKNLPTCCSKIAAKPSSCADISDQTNGIQQLDVNGQVVNTFCEGEWTVIQRHYDGSIDFNRNWNDYAAGFGDISGNFWWGNDKISALIASKPRWRLRVELEGFDGVTKYAEYDNFKVLGATDSYRLQSVGSYSGTAGNSFEGLGDQNHNHVGKGFSTPDRDNDSWSGSCAKAYNSGWWFAKCHKTNLNGQWNNKASSHGIQWYTFYQTHDKGLKSSKMMIKPY